MKRLTCFLVSIGLMTQAQAGVITYTDSVEFEAAAGSLTLEDFNNQTVGAQFHSTDLDLGAFTLSMTGSPTRNDDRNEIDGPPPIFSVFNVDGTTIANVLTRAGDSLFLTFDTAIQAFAVDLAGFNDDSLRTSIIAAGATTDLEPSSGDVLRFFGLTSDTAFTSVEFRGLDNDGFGIDNVRFSASLSSVPEPASLALLGFGLFGLGLKRRKRR